MPSTPSQCSQRCKEEETVAVEVTSVGTARTARTGHHSRPRPGQLQWGGELEVPLLHEELQGVVDS